MGTTHRILTSPFQDAFDPYVAWAGTRLREGVLFLPQIFPTGPNLRSGLLASAHHRLHSRAAQGGAQLLVVAQPGNHLGRVPQLGEESRHELFALRTQGIGCPPRLMTDAQWLGIPQGDGVVAGGGHQGLAVRAEGQGEDVVGVPGEPSDQLFLPDRRQVPEPDGPVAAGRGKPRAARVEDRGPSNQTDSA
jgi:hypothetical protein